MQLSLQLRPLQVHYIITAALPHLFLLAVRSVRSVPGSQVCLGVPVLPATLEVPVCQALLGVLAQCGWRLVDWVRGSGWSCSAPCDLKTGKEDDVPY